LRAVVELDDTDSLVANLAAVCGAGGDAATVRDAQRGNGSAQRNDDPDLDLGLRRRTDDGGAEDCRSEHQRSHFSLRSMF
jgi:hypothetical protein